MIGLFLGKILKKSQNTKKYFEIIHFYHHGNANFLPAIIPHYKQNTNWPCTVIFKTG